MMNTVSFLLLHYFTKGVNSYCCSGKFEIPNCSFKNRPDFARAMSLRKANRKSQVLFSFVKLGENQRDEAIHLNSKLHAYPFRVIMLLYSHHSNMTIRFFSWRVCHLHQLAIFKKRSLIEYHHPMIYIQLCHHYFRLITRRGVT